MLDTNKVILSMAAEAAWPGVLEANRRYMSGDVEALGQYPYLIQFWQWVWDGCPLVKEEDILDGQTYQ